MDYVRDRLPAMTSDIARGRSPRVGIVLAAAIVIAVGVPTSALGVTFYGAGSYWDEDTHYPLTARVDFESAGDVLTVTLTNISNVDVLFPSQILTGVFFDLGQEVVLNPLSAMVAPGSTVLFTDGPAPTEIQGEWAYRPDVGIVALGGGDQGLGSSGYAFGPGDVIGEPNLSGPDAPDGLQYGITSANDDPTTGNAKVTGDQELVKNAVVFTLAGLPDDYNLDDISNVWWQYGTSLDQPGFPPGDPPGEPPIPEPLTAGTVLLALVGLGRYTGRRARS